MVWRRYPLVFLGLSAAAACAGIAFMLLQTDDEPGRNTLQSYYMEVELTIEPSGPDDDLDGPAPGRLRASYAAPASFKYEYTHDDPAFEYLSTVQMSDGETLWYYDGLTNSYSYTDVTEDAEQYADPIVGGFFIGRVYGESIDAFLDEFTQTPGSSYTVRGKDTVLGRKVDVIELASGGLVASTIWVDREYDFVLRYERLGAQSVRAQVVQLEYNPSLPDDTFAFDPPPGARGFPGNELSTSSGGSLGSGPGIEVLTPPGFRAPSFLPAGYEARRTRSSTGPGDTVTQFGVNYERRDGSNAYVHLRQVLRSGALPPGLIKGRRVQVAGLDAFVQTDGPETTLIWTDGGLMTTLVSNVETADGLIRIGESLQ